MTESAISEDKVYTFVLDQIETVPHLEALLLLWNSRPQPWTVENLSKRLYVSTEIVNALLDDLVRRGLVVCIQGTPEGYRYESSSIAQDQLLSTLDSTYRRETVRISTMIHSKPSASVREFARAFLLRRSESDGGGDRLCDRRFHERSVRYAADARLLPGTKETS